MVRPKGSKNKKGRLAVKNYLCPTCVKKFERRTPAIYCSYKCKGITQKEKYKGKGNPFYGKSFKHKKETKIKIGNAVKQRPLKEKLTYIGRKRKNFIRLCCSCHRYYDKNSNFNIKI